MTTELEGRRYEYCRRSHQVYWELHSSAQFLRFPMTQRLHKWILQVALAITVEYPPCFPSKIHFHIPYKMSGYLFPSHWDRSIFVQYLKSNTDIIHLFLKWVGPETITVLLIKTKRFFSGFREFNTVLVDCFSDSWLNSQNNIVPFSQKIWTCSSPRRPVHSHYLVCIKISF